MSEPPSVGETVYIAGAAVMPCDPVAFVHEAVVEAVVPGYGIVRKIAGNSYTSKSEDVYLSKREAYLAVALRLRRQLEKISEIYAARISEMESRCA
jgi:hypothetical protein